MNLSYFEVTQDVLEEVLLAVEKIFPDDRNDFVRHYNEYVNKDISDWREVRYWKYYCVRNDKSEIVAITGLYNEKDKHAEDEVWLGWFGVIPKCRGMGIGREVLEWSIKEAKQLGYKKLKLWTTTYPDEANAQELYEKVGLKIFHKEKYPNTEYEKLYREIVLI